MSSFIPAWFSAKKRRDNLVFRGPKKNLTLWILKVSNQTNDSFRNLEGTFPVRKVPNTFEPEPVIPPGKKPLKAFRLSWVVTVVRPALNHESGRGQTLHFTEPSQQ